MRVVQMVSESVHAAAALAEAERFHALFGEWGWESEVRVGGGEPVDADALLMLHYCNVPPADALPKHAPERTAVVLHQLVPPLLVPFSEPNDGLFLRAEEQLAALAGGCALAIAHCGAACDRLERFGFFRIRRLPYLWGDPLAVEADAVMLKVLEGDGPLLFFEGDLHAGSNLEDLVRSAWYCREFMAPGTRIAVAGSPDLCPAAMADLRAMMDDYRIEDEAAIFTGTLDAGQRAACLRSADVFLQFSGADWTGAGLLNALAAGVPAVAFAEGAAAEVLEDAGILLPDTINSVAAEIAQRLVSDNAWRERVVARQSTRLEELSRDAVAIQLRSHLARVGQGL